MELRIELKRGKCVIFSLWKNKKEVKKGRVVCEEGDLREGLTWNRSGGWKPCGSGEI